MATKYQERISKYAARHGVSIDEARAHAQGSHGNIQRVKPIPGGVIYETRSAQRVRAEISRAATQGKRVTVEIVSTDGERRRLWSNSGRKKKPGATARYVLGKLGRSAATTKGAFAAQSGYDAGPDYDYVEDSELEVDEIAEYQLTVYD